MSTNRLEQKIIESIKRDGPITFEKFMEMALYDPVFGYYSSKENRIGREGDYYTSSHLHSLFGAMIGKQISEMWELMGKPGNFSIVEIASGAGYLCRDMLDYMRDTEFFDSLNYIIIEMNPAMRDKQRELLSVFSSKVRWFSSMNQVKHITGCIFSNELLDAFPVHLVRMEENLKEIYVDVEGDSLKEKTGILSKDDILKYFKGYSIELEEGYRTEVNLKIRDWLNDINNSLREGFVFTVDYGFTSRDYYSEYRNRGTLMCYHRHQISENPYQNIGAQDITAHVNFSSLKKWGEELGLKTIGFCGQGAFLVSLGIDEEIKRLASSSDDYLFELARIKKLIMPQGMGESHQVNIQYKGNKTLNLKGFSIRNQIKSLT